MEDDNMWKKGDFDTNSEVSCDNGSDESFLKHDADGASNPIGLKTFGDGPRNFEHGQVTRTTSELASLLLTTTLHYREDV
ncbi:hypothetical protein TNCV_2120001 [Trichonephila clavipes]|nr:hypothetical protein TNCV_2120001 [Trichonephila clavipes]